MRFSTSAIKSRLAIYSSSLLIAAAVLTAGCAGLGGNSPSRPFVSSTTPTMGDQSASTSRLITATFNESVDPATVDITSFKASTAAGPLVGTVSSAANVITLNLVNKIPVNTTVTATVVSSIKDNAGVRMARDYVFSFKTSATADNTPPTVVSTDPQNTETNVALNRKISATFSENIAPTSFNSNTFLLTGPAGPVSGVVTAVDNRAIFAPSVSLLANTIYTATITTGATDTSDNALVAPKSWTFTTGPTVDSTPPTVVTTSPTTSQANVPVASQVVITFSEPLSVSTVTSSSFKLTLNDGTPVASTVSYAGNVVTLTPTSLMVASTVYQVTVYTAVTDLAGNNLATNYNWSFATAP